MTVIVEEIALESDGRKIKWQAVFNQLHAAAFLLYQTGERYEIRMSMTSDPRRVYLYNDDAMQGEPEWPNVPAVERDYYRVGRYVTEKA